MTEQTLSQGHPTEGRYAAQPAAVAADGVESPRGYVAGSGVLAGVVMTP